MSDELLTAILTKVTAVGEDVASLKTNMESLVGNGQPGRIDKIEDEVDDLKGFKNKTYGVIAAFGGLEGIFHYLQHRFKF